MDVEVSVSADHETDDAPAAGRGRDAAHVP
jgi:hypothetical protein